MSTLAPLAWIATALALFVAAQTKFNTPPTQRSGTTFFLFYIGLHFYFLLTLAIWTFAILLLNSGATFAALSSEVLERLEFAVPIAAALLVVLSSLHPTVQNMDAAARSFCSKLAAIPREKDRLAIEIREHSAFRLDHPGVEEAVRREAERRGLRASALDFSGLTSPAGTYTKVFTLHCLFFVLPREKAHRSAACPLTFGYRQFMASHETLVRKAQQKSDALILQAKDYFALEAPTREITDHIQQQIDEVFKLFADLLSRAVLSVEMTQRARYRKLGRFGFWIDAPRHQPLGINQYTAVAIGVLGFFTVFFMLVPRGDGGATSSFAHGLFVSLMIAVDVGIASLFGVQAAHLNEKKDDLHNFPPLSSFVAAGLLAVAVCALLRLGVHALPEIPTKGLAALWDAVAAFEARLPWRVMPFFVAFGVGVACRIATRSMLSKLSARALACGTSMAMVAFCLAGVGLVQALRESMDAPVYPWPYVLTAAVVVGIGIGGTVPLLYRAAVTQWQHDRTQDDPGPSQAYAGD